MVANKTFKTKAGFCHVTPDKVVFTRDGKIENASKMTVGKTMTIVLSIYGVISVVLIYLAYTNYITGETMMTLFFLAIELSIIYRAIKISNTLTPPVIDRSDIRRVTHKPGALELEFNDNGKIKKRLIPLPDTTGDGQREVEKAIQIIKDEKLLS